MKARNEIEVRRRAAVYVFTGLALATVVALVQGRASTITLVAHRLVEMTATLAALACGALALVRHYGRRERHFLFVGLTFLGAAAFDAFGVLALVRAPGSPVASAAAGWGWIAGRIFLAVFLARLALLPRNLDNADLELDETTVYASVVLLAGTGLAVLLLAPLPPPTPAGARIGIGIAGLLLGVALMFNLRRLVWRRNVFEHGLVLSLVLGLGAQLVAAAGPFQPDSAVLLVARVLKMLSYVAVAAALLASVFLTYRALEQSRRALTATNRALQREITDRKATERELQIRTAFHEHLFESTPEAIVVLDREDRVQRLNAEFTRLFGYGPDDALGRPIGSLIVPSDRAGEADSFSEEVARGSTVSAETVRRRADGSLVHVSILGTPILVADGQIGVYGIYRDITDRTRAEQAMRRSAERLAAIIDSSPLAILTLDGRGVVRTWNPAAERLSGYSAGDVRGRSLESLPLGMAEDVTARIQEALRSAREIVTEAVWRRSDGREHHVSIATAPLEGTTTSHDLLVVAADITDRKRAEDVILAAKGAAEEASRSKSEFLASMSHELRTPLNSVIGFTRVLLKNKSGNLSDTELTYLDRIASNGEHLLALINNILDLSKVEAGKLQMEIAETDLVGLVRDTASQLEGRVTGGAVRLRTVVPDRVRPVHTDAHRLRQVLINLIGNALKFTDEGEIVVTLEADAAGHPLRIDVTDTGIGIPAERLAQIFEAFEQADRSTARRYGGTGLGLSISRGICRELGYDLTVRSAEGRGSTFSIVLPGGAPAGSATPAEAMHA